MTDTRVEQILLIASDDTLASDLKGLLESVGYHVHIESRGAAALTYAEQRCPDLVLVDTRLPDMEGYRVGPELRNRCDFMVLPVIFLTPTDQPRERMRIFTWGAEVCLERSCEPTALLRTVQSLLP